MALVSRKICLIGDFGVGKTSLIRRFVDRQFDDRYLSTVGVKISRKQIEIESGQALQLVIWDIEGQTQFKAIASSYLQGAKGAILVGDVTRPESLDELAEHIRQFQKINPTGNTIVALNKADLLEADQLELLVERYLFNNPCVLGTHPTSAKTNANVDTIFQTLARSIAN